MGRGGGTQRSTVWHQHQRESWKHLQGASACTCGLEPGALEGHPSPGQQGRQCPAWGQSRHRSPFFPGHILGAGLTAPAQRPSRADGLGPSLLTVQ